MFNELNIYFQNIWNVLQLVWLNGDFGDSVIFLAEDLIAKFYILKYKICAIIATSFSKGE